MNTLTNSLAGYNKINLVGADEKDQGLFNEMLEKSDADVLETLAFLDSYGLDIHFGDDLGTDKDGSTINGQAVVGGNKIVLDDALLEDSTKLRNVFAHELAHILGASHETNDEEDEKFEELVGKLTDDKDADLNSVFEQYKQLQEKENQSGTVENDASHGDHGKKDDKGKNNDKVGMGKGVEDDTEDSKGMGHGDHGGGNYADALFAELGTIADTIGFDILAEFDKLYDGLEGTKIGGKENRDNRDKYNEGIIQIMTSFFKALDEKVLAYENYENVPDELKEGLDATAKWIQLGLHAGKNNDDSSNTHGLETATEGKEGAAFVIAHGMQAGDDTEMHTLFRNGDRGLNQDALDALDGAKLFELMKEDDRGLTGLYTGKGDKISTFRGASADTSMKGGGVAVQNPAGAIDYFKKNED